MDVQDAYQNTLQYLYERLPMFSKIGKTAIKKDLTNIRKLCNALDNPHQHFKSIHIAGTNGKGSTSHALAAVLQEAGYETGLYTSPHLIDFRERIRINGEPVSKEWIVSFIEKNKTIIEDIEPSFFEVTVAMAFQFFAEQAVDIAVIETGLGGRLDSTNIITPILSVITNISYDHQDVLGNTLKEIATEKAGIIKEKVPVLIGEQDDETSAIFFETAIHHHTSVYYADTLWDFVRIKQDAHYQYFKAVHKAHRKIYDLQTDLLGTYQQHNIKTVLAATEILNASQGMNITIEDSLRALLKVKKLTGLRGRWERLNEAPAIIADVGHNAAGIKEVMEQWQQIEAAQKHIIVGFVKDKDVNAALAFFPKDAIYHFCNAATPRALPASDLSAMANSFGLNGNIYPSVAAAISAALNLMSNKDALLITGSFFIVGEALEHLEKETKQTISLSNK